MKTARPLLLFTAVLALAAVPVRAQLLITEVMSQSVASGTTGGTNDWFELTNNSNQTISLAGDQIDDNSYAFATSVALNGVTSLAPRQSAVFVEYTATDPVTGTADDAPTQVTNFRNFWGGTLANTANPVGYYTGAGVGLGSGGDGVEIFNSAGAVLAQVSFGATTTGSSFYTNSTTAQNTGTATPLTLVSATGQPGVYTSANALGNIGSPDFSAAVPEPSSVALMGLGGVAGGWLLLRRRAVGQAA